ncbi:CRISPR-associated endonuclease Cas2 [Selenomonas sputigena]|uniref:CRISPR-associated endoribonuclease Cas2 n=1 Tax=Selenomonas sputigena TaxID=69823 RepID=A0ABV3X5W4_9FIRM
MNWEMEYEESEFIAEDVRRYIVLVIYDITDDKRRSRMVKCVERYGVRVQKSAFEAFLDEKKYERLVEETSRLIDVETDSLRIYLLANHTSVRSWGVGDRHVEDVIIF